MSSQTWKPISIHEGIHLRAFAILAILTHNFLHWIQDAPGENEFNYHPSRGQDFLAELTSQPSDTPRLLATFFGHYGVQIFILLSGYGLAIKYKNTTPNYLTFQKKRLHALFPSILVAALGYIIYESFRLGFTTVLQTEGLNLIRQITGIANFIPENIYHPIGPWWFISLILQFYLIAPPLIRCAKNYPRALPIALILLTLTLEYTITKTLHNHLDLNINHTILGHLDTIGLGILLAYHPPKKIPLALIVSAFAITIAGNFIALLWPLTSIAATIAAIPILRKIIQKIKPNTPIQKFLTLTGNLSLLLFLTNGYLRKPLITLAQAHTNPLIHILYLLIFLLLTYTISITLQKILNPKGNHPPKQQQQPKSPLQ